MGRPKKHHDLDVYASRRAYNKSEKGKVVAKRYESSEAGKARKRNWKRKHDGTILDKRQWFLDEYGDIDVSLSFLDDRETEVIIKIYGLDGNPPLKQKDIAEEWNTKPQWISKVKLSAIAKLEAAKQTKAEASEQDKNSSPPEAQREES